MACPDPEIVMGQGRALFRVNDLLELADLLARLNEERNGRCTDDT